MQSGWCGLGLELVSAVEALGEEVGVEGLTARVGGTSGKAAVGGDGNQGTGLIIGEVVNLALTRPSAVSGCGAIGARASVGPEPDRSGA